MGDPVFIAFAVDLLISAAEDLEYDLVLYAWGGLGAAFGPPLLFALWSKRVTKAGIIAGMLVGAISVIVWNNVSALAGFVYELAPAFALSALAVWVVTARTQPSVTQGVS